MAQDGHRTFYKRALPSPPAIGFSTPAGRILFQEALSAGTMESFFPLSEQFSTQAMPAFCGLASLAMVLNALQVDPKRVWQGSWRWFDEYLLDCCEPLDKVEKTGIVLSSVACLARCNGAAARLRRPLAQSALEGAEAAAGKESDTAAYAEFLQAVERSARGDGSLLIASYDRRGLSQTGEGHYSPLGGYHEGSGMVLILDVARFKYPPHWVSARTLWEAMRSLDSDTGLPRGYLVLSVAAPAAPKDLEDSRPPAGGGLLLTLTRVAVNGCGCPGNAARSSSKGRRAAASGDAISAAADAGGSPGLSSAEEPCQAASASSPPSAEDAAAEDSAQLSELVRFLTSRLKTSSRGCEDERRRREETLLLRGSSGGSGCGGAAGAECGGASGAGGGCSAEREARALAGEIAALLQAAPIAAAEHALVVHPAPTEGETQQQALAPLVETSRRAALDGLRSSPVYSLVQGVLQQLQYPACPTHDGPGGAATCRDASDEPSVAPEHKPAPAAAAAAAALEAASQAAAELDARAEASEEAAVPSRALAWTALLLAAPRGFWCSASPQLQELVAAPLPAAAEAEITHLRTQLEAIAAAAAASTATACGGGGVRSCCA